MSVLGHSESEVHFVCLFFFWIPDSVRKVLKFFEIFSQPARPVGKPNQPVHWVMFAGTAVWVLFFVCVGSWSFRVGIALHLFCWISNYVRKALEILRTSLNWLYRLENRICRFIRFFF